MSCAVWHTTLNVAVGIPRWIGDMQDVRDSEGVTARCYQGRAFLMRPRASMKLTPNRCMTRSIAPPPPFLARVS